MNEFSKAVIFMIAVIYLASWLAIPFTFLSMSNSLKEIAKNTEKK